MAGQGAGGLEVGARFLTASRTVTREEVVAFATAYDPQPVHLDDAAARPTMFGGLAASGWHTAALTMRLLVDARLPFPGGLIGSGGELAWPKPVHPGDTLQVELEILAITPSRSRPGRRTVAVRILTRNQHGETVQSFAPRLVVDDPAAAALASGQGPAGA